MPKDFLNAVGSFGEGFLKAIQSERERLKEEQQFKQRMAAENRQLDLMDSWKKLEYNYKQEKDRYDAEGDNTNLGSDLSKIAPDLQRNMFKGSDYPSIYGKDNPNYYIPNNEIPKQEQQKFEDLWEDINPNTIDPNTKRPAKLIRNKQTGEERYVENYREPKVGGSGGSGSSSDGSKEPKLTESGAKALAWLKSPIFTKSSGQEISDLTEDEIANEFSTNLQSLTKDVLGSRANNWFFNIVKLWGRVPTSNELDNEILKHEKNLSEKEINELNRLSEYLEDTGDGIRKINAKLKELREPSKFLGIF